MQKILLVEDDDALGRQLLGHLTGAGFEVDWEKEGDRALRANPASYALVVLDLMLPGAYGLDVLKRFRTSSDVPVLILSARDETQDKVRGFQLGADDYLTKPFWPEELLARVNARLRRPALQRGGVLEAAGVRMDLAGRSATFGGVPLELTRAEFDILAALLRRRGDAVSRSVLLEAALDPERQATERTLDVHLSRLRKKLGPAGARIETVWGVGYRFRDAS